MINEEKIKKRLTKIIKKYSVTSEINDNAKLNEDLGIDSLSYITIAVNVEKTFHINFDEKDLSIKDGLKFEDLYQIIILKVKEGEKNDLEI